MAGGVKGEAAQRAPKATLDPLASVEIMDSEAKQQRLGFPLHLKSAVLFTVNQYNLVAPLAS
jgi:hypothetical protein